MHVLRNRINSIVSILTIQALILLILSTVTHAQTALVIDINAGTGSLGALFSVDLMNGDRITISDFGDGMDGPLGNRPTNLTLEDADNALVIDEDAGTGSLGALFRVNLNTGLRETVSDFGVAPNTGDDPLSVCP